MEEQIQKILDDHCDWTPKRIEGLKKELLNLFSVSEQLVCGCGKNKPVRREPAYLHCDWCGSITEETK